MPAVSQSQRRLFGMALHNPSALYAKNRSLADLSHKVLHEFASTKGLKVQRVRKSPKPKSSISVGMMMRKIK